MNQEMLPFRVKNLIHRETSYTNPHQQLDHCLASSFSPIDMRTPASGKSPGSSSSNSQYPQLDCFMAASTNCATPTSKNMNYPSFCESGSVGFSKGSSSNGYNEGVAACDGNVMFSTLNKKQLSGEVFPYSEVSSSITACLDRDEHSDSGFLDGGPTFVGNSAQYISEYLSENHIQQQRCGQGKLNLIKCGGFLDNKQNVYQADFPSSMGGNVELPYANTWIPQQNPQWIPEISDNLLNVVFNKPILTHEDLLQSQIRVPGFPQFHQQLCEPYVQLDEPTVARSNCYSVEEEFLYHVPGQASKLPQLPLEQSHKVQHVPFENSAALLCGPSDAAKLTDYSGISWHRILLSYIDYKSMLAKMQRSQVSFLNHMHWTVCNRHKCNCDLYRALVSHYDSCHYSQCNICVPVRMSCVTGKVNSGSGEPKNDFSRTFYDGNSGGTSSYAIEDLLHPSKRLKMENSVLFDNELSLVAQMMIQPCAPGRLPHLMQWLEAPVHDIDAIKANKGALSPKEGNHKSITVKMNDVSNNAQRLDFEKAPFPSGEVINGCKQGEVEYARIGEFRMDESDSSQGLNSDSRSLLSEEASIDYEVEEQQILPKPDQIKLEAKSNLIAPAADYESGMESHEAKILGVSLAEFFTAEQLKEHIFSLRQSINQGATKEVTDTITCSVSENICQLCSMDKLVFAPEPLYCASCGARIKRNSMYYSTLDEIGTRHCLCTPCFRWSRRGNISVRGASISKSKLQKYRNSEEIEEPWAQCDKCKMWQHQICALFNSKRDLEGKAEYVCPCCCLEEIENGKRVSLPKAAPFEAKDLPSTMLSDHIEKRLSKRLKEEREERAKVLGKKVDEVPEVADLVVRVVLSVDKQLKVKQQFLDIFHGQNYPAEFLYRSKVILLFQKIEGVDVCLFGVYVQEYGSECDNPNQRSIYISYLDSVKYFRPEIETVTGEAIRTLVYHEILIAYLDYCKKRGFATCYIWACPPMKGEDYILYCHPEIQKTPKTDKLRHWYKSMLTKAAKDNVVVDYTNLYDYFFVPNGECNTKITAARLPYFDGGYWSCAAEDMIRNMEQESGREVQRKVEKPVRKRTLKAMGQSNCSGDATKDILVMQKLGQIILPVKEYFILVHLQFACTHCHGVILSGSRWSCNHCKNFHLCARCLDAQKNFSERKTHTTNSGEKHPLSQVVVNGVPIDTEDKDIYMGNNFLEDRLAFLSFCESNNYQFDTLRRAKHSSMMILYHLHKLASTTAETTCSSCH